VLLKTQWEEATRNSYPPILHASQMKIKLRINSIWMQVADPLILMWRRRVLQIDYEAILVGEASYATMLNSLSHSRKWRLNKGWQIK
jgi:hypothetical protein